MAKDVFIEIKTAFLKSVFDGCEFAAETSSYKDIYANVTKRKHLKGLKSREIICTAPMKPSSLLNAISEYNGIVSAADCREVTRIDRTCGNFKIAIDYSNMENCMEIYQLVEDLGSPFGGICINLNNPELEDFSYKEISNFFERVGEEKKILLILSENSSLSDIKNDLFSNFSPSEVIVEFTKWL